MTPLIGAVVRSILLASPPVVALIDTRVYPHRTPQGTPWPAVTYEVTSHEPLQAQSGRQRFDRFQVGIDCWSRERDGVSAYDEATLLSHEVMAALTGYRGEIAGARVHSSICDGSYDDGVDEETGICSVSMDFTIWAHKL